MSNRNRPQSAYWSKPDRPVSKTIYTSDSWMRQPGPPFLQRMWFDLLASRELTWQLMVKDIRAQYRQSLLGVIWAFIPPIILALGFTIAKGSNIVNIAQTDIPYPAYVMFSMTLWQTFVEALNGPIQAIAASKSMMAKINFPREAVVLAKIGQVVFNFGIKVILLIGVFVWFQVSVSWSILLAPVALIHLIALGTFFGLLLAPLSGLYNDVSKALGLIISPWLLLTPVVYPVPTQGGFGTIVKFNPVTPLLVTTRELATTGTISDPFSFWITSAIAIGGLFGAWLLYRVAMPYVIERVSS